MQYVKEWCNNEVLVKSVYKKCICMLHLFVIFLYLLKLIACVPLSIGFTNSNSDFRLSQRVLWLGIANLALSPLIFLWQILYSFFRYAEVGKLFIHLNCHSLKSSFIFCIPLRCSSMWQCHQKQCSCN